MLLADWREVLGVFLGTAALLKQLHKLVELLIVQVRDGAVRDTRALPESKVETLTCLSADGLIIVASGGPHEEVDRVQTTVVDDGRGRMIDKVVEASPGETEVIRGKIGNLRREIKLAAEPGLHRVLIAGGDIHQVVQLKRADVARDNPFREPILGGGMCRIEQ